VRHTPAAVAIKQSLGLAIIKDLILAIQKILVSEQVLPMPLACLPAGLMQ
jgi:hypothetical protein